MNNNFNCTNWENIYTYSYNQEVTSLAVFPDPDIFAARYNNNIVVQKISEKEPIQTLTGTVNFFGGFSTPIVVDPTGEFIATGMIEGWDENVIKLYNLKTNTCKTLGIHGYGNLTRVTAVAFSPNSKTVISAGGKTIKLWDTEYEIIERGELSGRFSNVKCLAVDPNDGLLAIASNQGAINIYKIASKKEILIKPPSRFPINSLAFSPDGQFLVSGNNQGKILIWNLRTGREYPFSWKQNQSINSVAFSPNGYFLATAYDDKTIKIWNLKNQNYSEHCIIMEEHDEAVTAVAFTPDGKKLISGSKDGTVRVWRPV
ncbi:MAG: WD40 repeat domain-containing protein [Planktothrix sp. GU0601_MAG3]|nr:MAG: WD40 repeat domain-containing protein [Planktothrix sp. GU0601_MAG3]